MPGRRGNRAGVYRRQPVLYRTSEMPGTIIIDTSRRFLYLIQANNTALRYGVGVGRDGFQWNGLLKITRKASGRTDPRHDGRPGNPMGAPRSISAPRSIGSTAPTRPRPSAMRYHPAASGWSTSR